MKVPIQHLTNQEKKVMSYFWAEDRPLTISNLSNLCNEKIEGHHLNVVIKSLITKGYLKVTGRTGNARMYYGTLSFEEYNSKQLKSIISTDKNLLNVSELLFRLTEVDEQIIDYEALEDWIKESKSKYESK